MDLFIHVLIVLLFVSCIHLYIPYIVCPKFFIRINPNFTALILIITPLYKYLFILCISVTKTILLWLLYIISTIVVKPFSVLFIKFKLPLKKLNQMQYLVYIKNGKFYLNRGYLF